MIGCNTEHGVAKTNARCRPWGRLVKQENHKARRHLNRAILGAPFLRPDYSKPNFFILRHSEARSIPNTSAVWRLKPPVCLSTWAM